MNLKEALKHAQVKIIDVRSVGEFQMGNVAGSVNIPLNEIPQHLDEFRNTATPMVFCCASGGRSGQATDYLQENGIQNCINGGGWMNVNYEISQK